MPKYNRFDVNPTPLDQLNGFVGIVSSAVLSLCFVAGVCFVLVGFYQWLERRKNPLMVSLSTVITWFILGGILILIKYIPMAQI